MIQLLDTTLSGSGDAALNAMFAARKSVFVDLLRWEVPVRNGRHEVDQFDDAHARYIILLNEEGRHLGSARLLPTLRPHILDTLFPMLCAGEPPRGADTLEITRFCLDRTLRAAQRRAVRDQLVTAIVDHAAANGIASYTGVAEARWFQQIMGFGWDCRPLGPPRPYHGSLLYGLRIAVDADTPAQLARRDIWSPLGAPAPAMERALGAQG